MRQSHRMTRPAVPHRRAAPGFTLVELLVTVVVLAVVLTLGLPALQRTLERNRVTSDANRLVSALHLARSEAVKRGERVLVCPSRDGQTCGGDWSAGWIVLRLDADGALAEVLRRYGPMRARVETGASTVNRLLFRPDGLLQGPLPGQARIVLAPVAGAAGEPRHLIVHLGGTVRVCNPDRDQDC